MGIDTDRIPREHMIMADIGERLLYQFPNMQMGIDFRYDADTGEILTWNVAVLGPRPASIAAYMSATENLEIPIAKKKKQVELEDRFQSVWDEQYGSQMAVGLVLYTEFKTDPRTVTVTTAKNNFNIKMTQLNDLGRSGRPALTIENINAIVW